MVVFKKEQIVIVVLCTMMSIFTFMFSTANQQTKETVVLPVSRKKGCD